MPNLLDVPQELFLLIAEHLEIQDILALRKACILFLDITRDRTIWLSLLHRQKSHIPFEPGVRDPDVLCTYTASQLEDIVAYGHSTQQKWQLPRQGAPSRLYPKAGNAILAMQVLCDRWLLIVYCEGLIYLWDLGRPGARVNVQRCASLDIGFTGWTSCAVSAEPDNCSAILAMTRAGG
ncbi:hypothetical protein PLICRDRAFT_248449 [Plicaturopsis crispa FD-325 SS-3]|nr:hypothetical protein PLICRDRAFT_248449 [Plicaturopsis crispa FD-325 SS-3]